MTGRQAPLDELRDLGRTPWGEAGNSTLNWCIYLDQRYVFKRYSQEFRDEINRDALDGLIDWRSGLAQDDRDRLDRVTAWPRCAVLNEGVLAGVLLPPAPHRFYMRSMSGVQRPRSMEYLIRFDTGLGEARGATVEDKKRALGNAVTVLLWLHRQDVRVNDLRESNILCTADGAAVHFVDCDVMSGPWGSVGPVAAPAYLADLLPRRPDRSAPPTQEVELARIAWLATFVLLDDFALRVVPVGELAAHIGAAEADLLRRTASLQPIDVDEWAALAQNWTEPPSIGAAAVPDLAPTHHAPRRQPPGPNPRPHQWMPDRLRRPAGVEPPQLSVVESTRTERVTLTRPTPWLRLLVAAVAFAMLVGLIAFLVAGGR